MKTFFLLITGVLLIALPMPIQAFQHPYPIEYNPHIADTKLNYFNWNSSQLLAKSFTQERQTQCGYLSMIFDEIVGVANSYPQEHPVILVQPGTLKVSNQKTAQIMMKRLEGRLKRTLDSRFVLIECKKRKGLGHIQIYILDKHYDLPFGEDTFLCA